ncbi:MAG: ABC1 kinase family protein [Saprospiraceae bacterium]
MAKDKIFRPGYRIRKAYWVAFRVLLSYLWLLLKTKFLGKKYYQNHIFEVHVRNAERVKKAILHLQGLFIKVGQLLSILSNFLPPAFHEPLEALQDQIPARPFEEIQTRLKKELGGLPMEIFAEFDTTPLASASIGQVHRAVLKTGESVVVKVQHANIESIAEVDLQVMKRLVHLTAYFFDINGIEHAYTQVQKMIEEELDFHQEASSMQTIGKNLMGEDRVSVPKFYPEFSTQRVLTSGFCEGVKINDIKQINTWKLDQTDIANRLVHAYCKMVFEDGFYHADPHPGNILIQEDGTIIFLDFGAVAELPSVMRTGFLSLIDAAVKNDNDKIISSLRSMGFLAENQDVEATAEKMIDAFRFFIQNEVQINGLNFEEIKVNPFETSLFSLLRELGVRGITNTVQVPKEFVLLNRMVTLLLGICNTLDTSMNPIEVLQPYLQKFILGEQGNFVQFITELIKGSLTNAIALPGELQKTLKLLQKGELAIEVKGTRERNQLFYVLGQQLIYAVLLVAALSFTYLFDQNAAADLRYYSLGAAGLFLLLLLRSKWRNRKLLQ